MKTWLSVVVVVAGVAVTCVNARSSVYSWAVPCLGTTVDRILACGYGNFAGARTSGRRDIPVLPASSAMAGMRVTQRGNDIVCYVDGYISAVGLMFDLSGGDCRGNFKRADNYLTVASKCSGYFLVTLCQPMI